MICCNVIVSQHSLPYRLSTQERVNESTIDILSNTDYLTLRLDSSLNNPQNSEMKFCENMKLTF